MSAAEPLRMCIAMDRSAAPVSGRVIPDGGPQRAFSGWTELFAALHAVIADDHDQRAGGPPDAQAPASTTREEHE